MKNIMEYFVANWALILTFIFVVIYLGQKIVEFVSWPTEKKKRELKARLLEWTRKAEADLGSKTGAFKLSQVYNQFCGAYPYLKKWFPLEKFDELVKWALEEMEKSFANEVTKENALKSEGKGE